VEFCEVASEEIGVQLNVEGRYRWIVFLPSRMHTDIPVLNRYYGVFESGEIKVRGIEAVRRDTPPLIKNAQMDMIQILAEAQSAGAFRTKVHEAVDVLQEYVENLKNRDVDVRDLIIAKRLSMQPDKYTHDVFQAIAAKQLLKEGVEISGGQTVRYLITDAANKRASRRVTAAELVDEETRFDVEKYVDLLILAGVNILSPFGYTEDNLKDQIVYGEQQTVLPARFDKCYL
jgi:DNA polymerase elongation subunit (family B)